MVESFFCPFVLNPDHAWKHRVDTSSFFSFREEVSIHFLWLLTAPKRSSMCLSVLVRTILSLNFWFNTYFE